MKRLVVSGPWPLVILILFMCATFTTCKKPVEEKLVIAAASNMQFAIGDLVNTFTDQTAIPCEIILSSSGKLTAQIMEGAPFDIFLSADNKFPAELYNSGRTLSAPAIFAYGHLVLWSAFEDLSPSIEVLDSEQVRMIAIANPRTAPYGVASMELLQFYGIFDSIAHKIVYGESISQTNQFITSKAVEMGLTAKSVVLAPSLLGLGNWMELDTAAYKLIPQTVVNLKTTKSKEAWSKRFNTFLFSKEGREILTQYGYSF